MGDREVLKVITKTDEVFYVGGLRTYWYDVYSKERPELIPYKSKDIDISDMNRDTCMVIGPYVSKSYSMHKESCKSHEFDFVKTLEKPVPPGKVFHIYQFYNDLYYIEDDYINKYKNLQGFVFLEKTIVMHNMLHFVKEAEGMYREMKGEFYIYLNSKYVYLVNSDYIYQWKIYKERFHPNEEFYLNHTFAVPWTRTKWISYHQEKLLPFYTEEEVIRITKGIYRTRNVIPDKVLKKYVSVPTWPIEPLPISNKEDYISDSPEFYSFITLSNDEYLINIENIDEWQNLVEKNKYTFGFLHKKYLYSIQPYEYQSIKKGIYLRTKPVDPYKDSPPK